MRKEEWQGCPQSTCHSTLTLTLTLAFANAFVFEYAFAFAIRIGHRCMRYANWIRWAKFMHRRVCCPERRRPWMDWMRLELLLLTEETVGWRQADGQATVRYQHCALLHSERNATCNKATATATATGNREIYALFCMAKHATSILVNFSCTAGPGYRVHATYRNEHTRFGDSGLPLTQVQCKTKEKRKEEKRKANSGVPKACCW